MTPTHIITSGAYAVDELLAEFGNLPAAFLPVGHERLYDVQLQLLGRGTYLTLPTSYTVPDTDVRRLEAAGALLISVPDDVELGESILFALEMIGNTSGPVRLLHGDTIIHDLPADDDVIAVAQAPAAYRWGLPSSTAAKSDGEAAEHVSVMAGYFAFADGVALRRSLARARGDFVAAVHDYRRDNPMRDAEVRHWLDCGHLQTYYRSRCSVRTERAFNQLSMSFQVVEKRSEDADKLAAETNWFETLPPRLRLYTPGYLGKSCDPAGKASYATEYLPIPMLHELYVFGSVSRRAWSDMLESCFGFMEACLACGEEANAPPALEQLTAEKTFGRLAQYFAASGLPDQQEWRYRHRPIPSLPRMAEMTAALIDMEDARFRGIMHGDLCFTNIAYDFRTQRIRVMDPRGSIDGVTPTILGDSRYDLAKLNHSIVGGYDFVLADRYACEGFEDRDLSISFPVHSSFDLVNEVSREFNLRGLGLRDPQITAITIHLFLSMLPLHADRPDRQRAFLANALRLFTEIDRA